MLCRSFAFSSFASIFIETLQSLLLKTSRVLSYPIPIVIVTGCCILMSNVTNWSRHLIFLWMNGNVSPSKLQPNGNKRIASSSATTALNLTDDDMIDITPRDSINYNQPTMMAGDPNYRGGSASSPTHSAFAREFNEPDGEYISPAWIKCAFRF